MMRIFAMPIAGLFIACLIGCSGNSTTTQSKPATQPDKAGQGTHKIVGEWGFVKSSDGRNPDWGTTMEFSADGKIALRGPGYANAGTYTVDQSTLKFSAGVLNEKLAIISLSDRDLILEQPGFTSPIRLEYRKK